MPTDQQGRDSPERRALSLQSVRDCTLLTILSLTSLDAGYGVSIVSSVEKRMDFGEALIALKQGKRVAREGWNGKGMWLVLVRSFTALDVATAGMQPEIYWSLVGLRHEALVSSVAHLLPWIGMKTSDYGFVPWLASQTDLLAEDWSVVE